MKVGEVIRFRFTSSSDGVESTIGTAVSMKDEVLPSAKPTKEQERALELFLKSEGLRIDAYAGTGRPQPCSFWQRLARRERCILPSIEASRWRRKGAFLRA